MFRGRYLASNKGRKAVENPWDRHCTLLIPRSIAEVVLLEHLHVRQLKTWIISAGIKGGPHEVKHLSGLGRAFTKTQEDERRLKKF